MGLKKFKPTSPGVRGKTSLTFDEITKSEPEKSLVSSKKSNGGRNNNGHITADHKGGGHRKLYRKIDFKRDKIAVPAKVAAIEYDPNRTARIALLQYADGEKRYIICPEGLNVGDMLSSGPGSE
ncbi:MAG TPA: 50S ribosomal protein L2, partial [Candidatus Brocadiales bacterium]|nr:50S ribosomal protein L2 [Candidatus Brocadiales bacterium]